MDTGVIQTGQEVAGQQNVATTIPTGQQVSYVQSQPIQQYQQPQAATIPAGYVRQDQVDAIIADRLSREKKKYEPINADLEKYKGLATTYEKELTSLKQASYLTSKGIPSEASDYVNFEASKLVSDSVTFEQAIDKLLAAPTPVIQSLLAVSKGVDTNKGTGTENPYTAQVSALVGNTQTQQKQTNLVNSSVNSSNNVGANLDAESAAVADALAKLGIK